MRKYVLVRNTISSLLVTSVLMGVAAHVTRAYAQGMIPPSAEAARSQERFREIAPPSASGERPVASALPLQDAPDGANAIGFILNGIDISGSSVYSAEELAALYQDKVGQEVQLSWLFELANAITVKYRNDGYILSRAIIPQQEIHGGRVRIEIVEGYISNVIIQGAEGLKSKEQIEAYALSITRHRPVHMRHIERYLLLIRDMPGHNVESLLRPAEDGRGAADLILQISFDPAMVSAGIDNYGSKYLGPVQTSLRLQGNSLIFGGDRTVLRYVGTGSAIPTKQEELRYFDISHSTLLGNKGTALTLSASRIISYPGNTLEDLNTKSFSRVLSAEISHPLIRSRLTNLNCTVQFDMINASNQIAGDLIADDRLRALRFGGTFDHVDNWLGVTQLSVQGSQGLNIFGASDSPSQALSRAGADIDFRKINVDVARVQRVTPHVNLYMGLRGQYSDDILLSAEEFGVGGGEFGRGYDSSEITGDRGFAGRLELQYNGETHWRLFNNYQAFAFYDAGKVYQSNGKGGEDSSLASAGFGLRLNMGDYASGSFTLAKPLTKEVETRSDSGSERPLRGLFSFTVRY